MNKKMNWWLDAILFIGFVVTFLMDLTGLELHQWIGITIGICCGLHLILHWNWVETVISRFFGKTSWKARINLFIDAALMVGLGLIIFTGLIISSWLNLTFIAYDVWKTTHILASVSTLSLLLVKIVMHRKWIINTAEKAIFPQFGKTREPLPEQFQPSRSQVSRREFLKIGGLVGVTSLVGLTQVVKLVQASAETAGATSIAAASGANVQIPGNDATTADIQPTETISTQPATQPVQIAEAAPTIAPTAVPTQVAAAESCTVRCPRGCSYPGRCWRYTDSNGNGKCDLGECV